MRDETFIANIIDLDCIKADTTLILDMATEEKKICSQCGGHGELYCSGCRQVFYCSKEHQKTHWKHHKNDCTTYVVKSSNELGRYLVANRDLEPSDLVLTELPLVFGPKATNNPDFIMPCVGCYKPISTEVGERCPKCGWPVCSGFCSGLKDSFHHGLECAILSLRPECALQNMADFYRHDALLPLRCLMLQQKFPKKWQKIMEMQSHIEERKRDTETYQETNDFIVRYLMDKFLQPLSKLEMEQNKKVIPEYSSELIHTICGIIDTNALEIRHNWGTELLALYSNTCIMEHSCIPNTKHLFNLNTNDGESLYKITVKVVVPIKKDEHISTMYSHALWGTQARRQHLNDTKYFSCMCERCGDPTELGTYLSAMKCLGDGLSPCEGIHLPENPLDENTDWACNKCPIKVKNNQVSYIISKMSDDVEGVLMTKPTIKTLEETLEKLSTFLHPNHYHIFSIKHSLIQLYGHESGYLPTQMTYEIFQKKICMCKEMLSITRKLDPGNARLCLYTAVIEHELHLTLVLIVKKSKKDNKVKDEKEMLETIMDANIALKNAFDAIEDEKQYNEGEKLYTIFRKTKIAFKQWCEEIKVDVEQLIFNF